MQDKPPFISGSFSLEPTVPLAVDLFKSIAMKNPGSAIANGPARFVDCIDRLVEPMRSKFRHNLSPCKSACVLGLTSRSKQLGGSSEI